MGELIESAEKIKRSISDFCLKGEGILTKSTTDSAGNDCVEWQTYLILEVVSGGEEKSERSLSRQFVPAQFDVSFDLKRRLILVFLQWGKIEPPVWQKAEAEVKTALEKDETITARYYPERQVVELGAFYPFHEFAFSIVYEEIIGYFGLVNAVFFKTANDKA